MEQTLILYPVIALVFLTFAIGIWMARLRFVAVIKGDISVKYFHFNRGGKVPEYLAKVTHNYENLLEIPILFYTVCILLYATDQVEPAQLWLAWLFTVSRYGHSYIHTTSNRIKWRFRSFVLGAIVLGAMWCLFLIRTLQM